MEDPGLYWLMPQLWIPLLVFSPGHMVQVHRWVFLLLLRPLFLSFELQLQSNLQSHFSSPTTWSKALPIYWPVWLWRSFTWHHSRIWISAYQGQSHLVESVISIRIQATSDQQTTFSLFFQLKRSFFSYSKKHVVETVTKQVWKILVWIIFINQDCLYFVI